MHNFFNKYANPGASASGSADGSGSKAGYGSSDMVINSNTKSRELSPSNDYNSNTYNYTSTTNNYTSKYDSSNDYVPSYTFESKQ